MLDVEPSVLLERVAPVPANMQDATVDPTLSLPRPQRLPDSTGNLGGHSDGDD